MLSVSLLTRCRYVAVLELDQSNSDALHNWGKVLFTEGMTKLFRSLTCVCVCTNGRVIGALIQKEGIKDVTEEYCRQVELYCSLFCSFAIKCTCGAGYPFLSHFGAI